MEIQLMKKFLTTLALIAVVLILPVYVFAQEVKSNPVVTQAGNPKEPPPGISNKPTAPSPPDDIAAGIKQEFNITMLGFGQPQLELAWNKFWQLSNTNFKQYTSGAVIQAASSSSFEGSYCRPSLTSPNIFLRQEQGAFFTYLLIHELSHYIHNCTDPSLNGYTEHEQALAKEGAVSAYAKNPGACVSNPAPVFREDYAEMLAYYLVPEFNGQICSGGTRPNLQTEFPLHFQVAQKIIEKT